MRQLTSLDAQFLALENARTQEHVSVLGIYDPNTASGRPLDAALVRELVTERMGLLPTFRWRLGSVPFGLDYPCWVDDGTFDVEHHVRELALPSPGNERQLATQVADLIGRQLDRARPLWEVYVIHGLEDGAVAVLTISQSSLSTIALGWYRKSSSQRRSTTRQASSTWPALPVNRRRLTVRGCSVMA